MRGQDVGLCWIVSAVRSSITRISRSESHEVATPRWRTISVPAVIVTHRTRPQRAVAAVGAAAAPEPEAAARTAPMANGNVCCLNISGHWLVTCPSSRQIWICGITSRPLDIRSIFVRMSLSMPRAVAGKSHLSHNKAVRICKIINHTQCVL